jgi:uncharacterized protein YutE (UPF0331/DUF86 family)
VLDRERILAKVDELEGYQRELLQIAPDSIDEYQKIEKKRACERLLQISIETVIDIFHLLVKGLRLGLPAEEDDLFEKLAGAGIISQGMKEKTKRMKGFRNILMHRYGDIDDRIVYEMATERFGDFEAFKKEVLEALRERYDGRDTRREI